MTVTYLSRDRLELLERGQRSQNVSKGRQPRMDTKAAKVGTIKEKDAKEGEDESATL